MSGRGDSDKPQEEVWARLDRQFRAPLVAYFFRRLSDRVEAEDLTQEVFVRLTRNPDNHNGETIEAYVFKIAASVLRDWGRRRAVRRSSAHRSLSNIPENVSMPQFLVEDRTPERVLVGKENLREIADALNALGPRTRDIFLLARVEDLPYRDIAASFGISVSAVEKHVQKAFAHLAVRVVRHE